MGREVECKSASLVFAISSMCEPLHSSSLLNAVCLALSWPAGSGDACWNRLVTCCSCFESGKKSICKFHKAVLNASRRF